MISAMSPTGVEVACALTCTTSRGSMSASRNASLMARTAPTPSGWGCTMSYPSEVMPAPASRAYTLAPRARAWSARSSTTIPAPSPSTKPSRALSKGRDAFSGSLLRVDHSLGTPGDHHVGAARTDHVQAHRDRLRTGGTRARRRVYPGLGAELQADPGGGAVGHEHRYRVRRDRPRAARLQEVVLREQGQGPADAAADDHPEALLLDVRSARVGPSLPCGDDRHLLDPVQPAGLHAVELLGRLHRQLCRDTHRKLLSPLLGELAHPGAAGDHRLYQPAAPAPVPFPVAALLNPRHKAHPGTPAVAVAILVVTANLHFTAQ